jgi:structural maintenance of chromosome 3 (chondroitin sulfate proteoglycan 6)
MQKLTPLSQYRLFYTILKGNPYYIVQQGKVNALCTMSSADRLELLKEVAGCTVYDEKRADSLKQMEENRHSR